MGIYEFEYGGMGQFGDAVIAVSHVGLTGMDEVRLEGFSHVAVFLSHDTDDDGWDVFWYRVAEDGTSPDDTPLGQLEFEESEGMTFEEAYRGFLRVVGEALGGYLMG